VRTYSLQVVDTLAPACTAPAALALRPGQTRSLSVACTDPDATCNPTFYCDGSNCVKEKAAKAKCTASYECAGGFTCDADTTSATAGTCITATPNASCTSDADCPAGTCEAALNACVSSVQLAPAEAICGDLR